MCIPHAPIQTGTPHTREKKRAKKHIEFDKKRLDPDPDFVDERKEPEEGIEAEGFWERIKRYFS